jgi:YesN/AraC family two-component response regulator
MPYSETSHEENLAAEIGNHTAYHTSSTLNKNHQFLFLFDTMNVSCFFALMLLARSSVNAFQGHSCHSLASSALNSRKSSSVVRHMAQVSQQEAQKGIDKVVAALRKDSAANVELGRLDKVLLIFSSVSLLIFIYIFVKKDFTNVRLPTISIFSFLL